MIIGVINILTTSYFLAIQKVPFVLEIFPTFQSYIIFVIAVGIPIVTVVGWLHFKRIGTFSTEAAIHEQAFPYNYKLLPGYNKEVFGPAYVEILRLNRKKILGEKLSDDETNKIKSIEKQLEDLINGGHAGNPPKGAFS